MRPRARARLVAAIFVAIASTAAAEPLPSGALGIVVGGASGTGADSKRVGVGYGYGLQASWQPTTTEHSLGGSLRWSTMFATMYPDDTTAAHIQSALHIVQMDLTLGLRARPWASSQRWLSLRGGAALLRANEPIVSNDSTASASRAFVGPIASVGIDQYLGSFMFSVDVRYGMIGTDGPSQLTLLLGFAVTGP